MEGPGGRYTSGTPETTVAWLWGALVGAIVGFIVGAIVMYVVL